MLAEWGEDAAEDRDEYIAENIFWVPAEARWTHLRAQARQPTVGLTVDQAMVALERDNPALKDVLPRDYARPAIDKRRLGQLIALISNIQVGDAEAPFPRRAGPRLRPLLRLVGDVCAVDGVHPRPRQLKVLLACELADFHRPSPYRTSINSTPKL